MARLYAAFLFLGILFYHQSHGQTKNEPGLGLSIKKATSPILLDGELNEDAWKNAMAAKDFYLNYPVDTALAKFQTEARITFDEQMLYVSFVCYDDHTPDVVQSLRRDFDFITNDNVSVFIGPYNDKINGFYFTVTPRGVQLEGTVSTGGANDNSFNSTWDNKWYSKVVKHADRWVAELAIPFKSFRYKSGLDEWNITFLRYDLKRNQVSSWIATPIQFIPASFAYSGQLKWEDPTPKASMNISLIPYVAGIRSADYEQSPTDKNNEAQVGIDAKVAVTPSLNLDLTVNPDFSQVEVDRQVINLTRFEFRFPERRQFFLENNDIFEGAGFPETRPFFSRRVGIAKDSAGNLARIPITFGARLSGSLSQKWRLSVLNMQTKESKIAGLPTQNYTVAAIQHNFWKQSNVSFIYVDKESLGVNQNDSSTYFNENLWKAKVVRGDTTYALNKYNRLYCLDIDLLSADNKYGAGFFISQSFDDFSSSNRFSGGTFLSYKTRNLSLYAGNSFVQKNYNAESGYVPSNDVYPGIYSYFTGGNIVWYPKSKILVNHGPSFDLNASTIPNGTITDKEASLNYSFNFLNTSSFTIGFNHTYQQLTSSFNPIDEGKYASFIEGDIYKWSSFVASYSSDQRKRLTYGIEANDGYFYNGRSYGVRGNIGYRFQPYGSFSLRFDYNDLKFPDHYGKEKLFLVGPRVDITFTDKLFLTTFVQYNNINDNVNLNTRFQWRFKPASDFYIVYTENYLPGNFNSKNRALVLKLTYWLNL